MVDKLNSAGTPYKLTNGGTTVLVPQNDVYDSRISLSGEGLPSQSSDGYGLLDKQSLSTSQEIHITGPVIDSPAVATILEREAIKPIQKQAALRGIADKIVVYEIP